MKSVLIRIVFATVIYLTDYLFPKKFVLGAMKMPALITEITLDVLVSVSILKLLGVNRLEEA